MKVSLSVTSIFIILYSIFCGSKKLLRLIFFKNRDNVGFNNYPQVLRNTALLLLVPVFGTRLRRHCISPLAF